MGGGAGELAPTGREAERHAADEPRDLAPPGNDWPPGSEPYEDMMAKQAVDDFFDTFFDVVDDARDVIDKAARDAEAAKNTCHDGDDPFSESDHDSTPPELRLHEPNTSYPGDTFDPDVDGDDEGFPVS